MTENPQTSRVTRRQALRGARAVAAGTAASLAGCSVPFLGSSDPVLNIKIQPLSMVVTVDKDADVDTVSIYSPEGGDPQKTVKMAAGQQKVVFKTVEQLGLSLRLAQPGKYRVVAGRKGETVAEQTIKLIPKPKITSVKPGMKNGTPTGKLVFELKNAGTLPVSINYVEINGVPIPASGDADNHLVRRDKVMAPQDRLAELPSRVKRIVTPNSTGTFVPKPSSFLLGSSNINKFTKIDKDESGPPVPCVNKQWTASIRLELVYRALTQQFTYSFDGETTFVKEVPSGKVGTCTNISVNPVQNQSSNESSPQ
jgi:hypothetical protein